MFTSILKTIAVPIVAIIILQNSFLGQQGAFLAVTIAMTVVVVFSVLEHVIVMLPNIVLLKPHRIFKIGSKIFVEVGSLLAFWVIYFSRFHT